VTAVAPSSPDPAIASLMPIVPRPDIVFERGQGACLYDSEGRRYLDWVQGWAVNCLGHAPAVVAEALARQAATLINPSPAFYNRPAMELASPQVPGFPKAVLNDIESVARLVGPKTVAVMLEPLQGEGGVIPASTEFIQGLRTLCDREHLLLIVDEVQTGCGRTGTMFAYEHYGIEPDIMTLGKGIGGGVPLSALLAKKSCSCFVPGDQGGTYCGNPLVCAAGVAVIQTLTAEGFMAKVGRIGKLFADGLRQLSSELGLGEVRGKGLLLALELGRNDAAEIVVAARELGLLVNAPRAHCLRFMPALNTTEDEIAEGLALLRRAIASVPVPVPVLVRQEGR